MERYIVTHQHPDMDAIGAAWLLQRYGGLADCTVKFVNTGDPDQALLDSAAAVVDTGGVYDTDLLRFDHHTAEPNSATMMVYRALTKGRKDMAHLEPLIDLIHADDIGDPLANQSREVGMHALLSASWAEGQSDSEACRFGMMLLNMIDGHLKSRHDARQQFWAKVVYKSDDNSFMAIKDGNKEATDALFEHVGAAIVLFQSEIDQPDGSKSYAIGMQRNQKDTTPHLGELVVRAMDDPDTSVAIRQELMTWFLHPVGFFAGRGTAKAPSSVPIAIDLKELALALDRNWVHRYE